MKEEEKEYYLNENLNSIFIRELIQKLIKEDPNKRSCFIDLIKIKKIVKIIISEEDNLKIGIKFRELTKLNNEDVKYTENLEFKLK